jgi:hypothetical protein
MMAASPSAMAALAPMIVAPEKLALFWSPPRIVAFGPASVLRMPPTMPL